MLEFDTTLSVTDANARGVAGLVRDAEDGHNVVIARRGKPVAAVVSTARLAEIEQTEADLRDSILVLTRMATDGGAHTSLDEVIERFGFDRAELEAELDADLASDR